MRFDDLFTFSFIDGIGEKTLKKLRGVIAAGETAANSFNSKVEKFVCRFYMPSSTEASAK